MKAIVFPHTEKSQTSRSWSFLYPASAILPLFHLPPSCFISSSCLSSSSLNLLLPSCPLIKSLNLSFLFFPLYFHRPYTFPPHFLAALLSVVFIHLKLFSSPLCNFSHLWPFPWNLCSYFCYLHITLSFLTSVPFHLYPLIPTLSSFCFISPFFWTYIHIHNRSYPTLIF